MGSIIQDCSQANTLLLPAKRLHEWRNMQGAEGWQSHQGEVTCGEEKTGFGTEGADCHQRESFGANLGV